VRRWGFSVPPWLGTTFSEVIHPQYFAGETDQRSIAVTPTPEPLKINRLEDFISQAKQGKSVKLEITLKTYIWDKVYGVAMPDHQAVSEGTKLIALVAHYAYLLAGEEEQTVSKVYAHGWIHHTADETFQTQEAERTANQRLKRDYERLRHANVIFEEKCF